jgi:LPXTG-motif cell wall-anchored protein
VALTGYGLPMAWWALGGAALLQLIAGVIRVRAWFHVIRDSCPEASDLRYRDVVLAHLGGVGWNAILPAHAGDAVKVVIVSRRVPGRRLAMLAATLVPPGLVEAAFTAILLAGILAAGLVSVDVLSSSLPATGTVLVVAGVACVALVALFFLRRRLERLIQSVRAGLSVLGRPRILATHVVPWLLVGRVVRLLAFALVLTAAGVAFGLLPALALMALQGATPSAGAAATAARIALIAAVLAGTGAADVPATDVAEALAAAYGVTSAVNLAVSAAVIAVLLGTTSPRRVVAYARSAMRRVKRERARPLEKPGPVDGARPPSAVHGAGIKGAVDGTRV